MDLFLDKQQLHECETINICTIHVNICVLVYIAYVALGWVEIGKDR